MRHGIGLLIAYQILQNAVCVAVYEWYILFYREIRKKNSLAIVNNHSTINMIRPF